MAKKVYGKSTKGGKASDLKRANVKTLKKGTATGTAGKRSARKG